MNLKFFIFIFSKIIRFWRYDTVGTRGRCVSRMGMTCLDDVAGNLQPAVRESISGSGWFPDIRGMMRKISPPVPRRRQHPCPIRSPFFLSTRSFFVHLFSLSLFVSFQTRLLFANSHCPPTFSDQSNQTSQNLFSICCCYLFLVLHSFYFFVCFYSYWSCGTIFA